MTYEDYLKQNGIDPTEAAFVRLAEVDLPTGCDDKRLAAFVEENAAAWSALQREDLERDQAAADGTTQLRLAIASGKPSESTVTLDSTGSIRLMERLQADFSRIQFAPSCAGAALIKLRFHLPSEPPRGAAQP